MSYSELRTFFLSSLLIVLLVPLSSVHAQQSVIGQFCFSERGNYTNGSTYEADLNSLLTSFSNTQVEYGFYNSSVGEVNGIGLCRGDLSPETCRSCISNSSQDIPRLCPNSKEVALYYDLCLLRYSNRSSIFGTKESSPVVLVATTQNVSDIENFAQKRADLLLELRGKAASGGTNKKYATGETSVGFETIYGLVQCTPDLEYQECYDCLDDISQQASEFMKDRPSGHALSSSCNFRFATDGFYEQIPDAPPPPSPAPSNSSPPPSNYSPPTNDTFAGDGMRFICLCFQNITD